MEEIKTCIEDLKKYLVDVHKQQQAELEEIKKNQKNLKRELQGLIEIQQKLIHERLGSAIPSPPKEYGEEPGAKSASSIGIDISSSGKDRINITGKRTFDIRDSIKEAGSAKFDQATKTWSLPLNCLQKLITNLESLNLKKGVDFIVNVKDQDGDGDGGFGSGL